MRIEKPATLPEDIYAGGSASGPFSTPGSAVNPGGVGWQSPDFQAATAVPREVQSRKRIVPKRGHFVGQVHNFREQMDNTLRHTWTFRLVDYDAVGNLNFLAEVSMRAATFEGTIGEGDWVEVQGSPGKGGVLKVKEVYNHTTETRVKASISFFNWLRYGP